MAKLILTDEEKAAATWFELDDAALGMFLKKVGTYLLPQDERDKSIVLASALFLINIANESNSTDMNVNLDGCSNGLLEIGDWSISVKRVDK